jgi:hypothetical protein
MLIASEEDRRLRFEQIQTLTSRLVEAEADRAARGRVIEELTRDAEMKNASVR